jgi:hypothetical protein
MMKKQYLYTGSSIVSKGGRKLSPSELASLPENEIEQLLNNKIIKHEQTSEPRKANRRAKTKKGDQGRDENVQNESEG